MITGESLLTVPNPTLGGLVRLRVALDKISVVVNEDGGVMVVVTCQTERSFKLICIYIGDEDLPIPDISCQKTYRYYGKAFVIQNGAAEGLGAGGFPCCMDIHMMPFDKTVEQRSGSASFFTHDTGLMIQFRHVKDLFPGKRMFLAAAEKHNGRGRETGASGWVRDS